LGYCLLLLLLSPQGTPLRIEIGPRDLKNGCATLKLRIDTDRVTTGLDGGLCGAA